MGSLADFFNPTEAIPSNVQKSRDLDALSILDEEYRKKLEQIKKGVPSGITDPNYMARLQADLQGLGRERKRFGGQDIQPDQQVETEQEPQGLASFFTRPVPSKEEQLSDEMKLAEKPYIRTPKIRSKEAIEAQGKITPEFQAEREKEKKTLKDLALGGASLADVTVGGVLPMAGQVVQAVARPFTTPKRAEEISGSVTSALEKPFGKTLGALGVGRGTEDPAYKQEASRRITDAIAEYGNQGADVIAQKTGLPVEDVRNMMGTAMVGVAPVVSKTVGKGVNLAREVVGDVKSQLQQQLVAKQQQTQPTTMQSGGAAAVETPEMIRGNINAAILEASPELAAHVQTLPPQKVNIPVLETKALEEKHGVNLTVGQRTGSTPLYAQEWNKRGETTTLGEHFNEQPAQISKAFDQSKERNAPDISSTADASELGQHEINGLAAKDAIRVQNIDKAYQDFRDAYVKSRESAGLPIENDFPVNGNEFLINANKALTNELLQHDVPAAIKLLLDDISTNNGKMTFNEFINLDKRLSAKTKEGTGSERQAAFVIREQLQNIPLEAEAAALEPMYRNAVSLAKERFDVIKSNPAYKKAIGEAADLKELSSQGESLDAAKFHNKYVANGTPESIRRMKAELDPNDIAHQAIIFAELNRAKNAAVNASERNLTPEQFATFLKNNKSNLRETLSPQAMQDVTELGLLASKIGMPKTGTFNYSNSYSSMLADFAKQGLLSLSELKLAGATGGASIPAVGLTKQWMQKLNKEGFAKEATNPYGGLTKD